MAVTNGREARAVLNNVEHCCRRANEYVAQAAILTSALPDGRGDILQHTKAATDALARLLKECKQQYDRWAQIEDE